MSFRVLVIPEDPTHNGYILRPLVQALMAEAGRPNARVHVLNNPKLGGYDHAVRAIRDELPGRYSFYDLWIFIPDADRATPDAMRALEKNLADRKIPLLCCPAQPEVEIYASAAFSAEIPFSWEQARANTRFKEEVFAPLLAKYGDARRAGLGRDLLIAESLNNLPRLLQLCPELCDLLEQIRQLIHA